MSDTMTFRVIENYEPVVDYEEFKKDFLDPTTRVDELKKKYGLSKTRWIVYRDRVYEECGINRKPTANYRSYFPDELHYRSRVTPIEKGWEFIRKVNRGYIVIKTINHKTYYFGRYKNYDCAMKVRDKLLESNWDVGLGMELKMKYGMDRMKPAMIKARKLYPKFEYLYIYSDKLIEDIKKELGLTCMVYKHLVNELHERHGDLHRNYIRELHGVTTKPQKKNYDCEM